MNIISRFQDLILTLILTFKKKTLNLPCFVPGMQLKQEQYNLILFHQKENNM